MSQRLRSSIVLHEAYAGPKDNAETRQQKAAKTRARRRREEQLAEEAIAAAALGKHMLFSNEITIAMLTIYRSSNSKG
jgi:hypothetical protein